MPLEDTDAAVEAEVFEVLSVNDALDRLADRDERMARVVECRFFGGMHVSGIAEALGVSERTVERDWRRTRAYLVTILSAEPGAEGASS